MMNSIEEREYRMAFMEMSNNGLAPVSKVSDFLTFLGKVDDRVAAIKAEKLNNSHTNQQLKGTPGNPLEAFELPDDVKKKVKEKYIELKAKFPHMKPNRLIKKAGEACGIKFILE